MRIKDLLSEEKAKVPPKRGNPVAHAAQKVAKGSGGHTNPKNTIPRKEKHKKDLATMESALDEISLGDYRKKALMQKAKSQMGAMFNDDPERQKQHQATFDKREKGLDRLKARDEVARKTTADKQMADNIAKLPELKAEYERMKAEYTSLGGNNWQYADREQNLTDRERKARGMESSMNNLWRTISAAEKAQKSEGMAEGVRDLGYDAQSLITKLRRDVEEKRLQPTRQAVLMAARELAGDMDFAPELLVQQVLGQGVTEGLDHNKRQQLIQFLVKKLDWEANYLELATDAELIKWYKNVQAGKKPMGY